MANVSFDFEMILSQPHAWYIFDPSPTWSHVKPLKILQCAIPILFRNSIATIEYMCIIYMYWKNAQSHLSLRDVVISRSNPTRFQAHWNISIPSAIARYYITGTNYILLDLNYTCRFKIFRSQLSFRDFFSKASSYLISRLIK